MQRAAEKRITIGYGYYALRLKLLTPTLSVNSTNVNDLSIAQYKAVMNAKLTRVHLH